MTPLGPLATIVEDGRINDDASHPKIFPNCQNDAVSWLTLDGRGGGGRGWFENDIESVDLSMEFRTVLWIKIRI